MTITLTRDEAQQVLDALEDVFETENWVSYTDAKKLLRARLAQPEPEPVATIIKSHQVGGINELDYYQEDIDAIPVGAKLYIALSTHELKPVKENK
jgi:hypothetical protein